MIHLNRVSKTFANGHGIFDLSFMVEQGEVFGYLGPNGAGKSTTIRLLMGFLQPDQGRITLRGLDSWQSAAEVHQSVGYLPGEIGFFDNMTGTDFLTFIARLHRMHDTQRRDDLLRRFDLDLKQPIRKMSKGTKQKLGIVAAFMHEPDVLILDEPTSGLDPLMQLRFIELLEETKARGATIFMSSHLFPEIERVADRVGVLQAGRLLAIEDVKRLRDMQRKVFSVVLRSDPGPLEIPGCKVVRQENHTLDIEVGDGDYNALIRALGDFS